MNKEDRTKIEAALTELQGVTGPEYVEADRDYARAINARDKADRVMQERFIPHRLQIMRVIRRELKARGMVDIKRYDSSGRHVYVASDDTYAVGISHTDYTVCASLRVEVWTGHGVELKWSAPSDTVEHFERSFAVFLATVDGYMAGAKAAGGRDCKTCTLLERWKGNSDRCKKCTEGSLWL